MGDKYIYVYYHDGDPYIAEDIDDIPDGINEVERYILDRKLKRPGAWS